MSVTVLDDADQRVLLGAGVLGSLPEELAEMRVHRVLVVASGTLHAETPLVDQVHTVLGDRATGAVATIRGHTPEEDVANAVQVARAEDADAILSLGGGGAVDGAKHVIWRLTDELRGDPVGHIAVPTTLSGAEFTHLAGITVDGVKTGVGDVGLVPDLALLDPDVAAHTPRDLWAWTGVRALDTAVEGFLQADAPEVADRCLEAAQRLAEHLPVSARDARDLDACAACYRGSWGASIGTLEADAARGPSHVLGKVLGATYGIQHGLTSALTLPMVLEWWAREEPERTARVALALGADEEDPDAAAPALRRWLDGMKIQRPPLRELGVPREALDDLEEDLLGPVAPELVDGLKDLW